MVCAVFDTAWLTPGWLLVASGQVCLCCWPGEPEPVLHWSAIVTLLSACSLPCPSFDHAKRPGSQLTLDPLLASPRYGEWQKIFELQPPPLDARGVTHYAGRQYAQVPRAQPAAGGRFVASANLSARGRVPPSVRHLAREGNGGSPKSRCT